MQPPCRIPALRIDAAELERGTNGLCHERHARDGNVCCAVADAGAADLGRASLDIGFPSHVVKLSGFLIESHSIPGPTPVPIPGPK